MLQPLVIPFPATMIQMFHQGTGMVLETVNDCQTLRPNIVKTHNVQAMITTGAGTCNVAAVNGNGDFLFAADAIALTQHATYQSDNEKGAALQVDVWRPFLTFFVPVAGKGWRQAGAAQINVLSMVKAACEAKPFEFAGELFVATQASDTTPVKLCVTSQATPLERTQLQAWLDNNQATVTLLEHRTVSTAEVSKQLKLFMKIRTAKMTNCMKGMYGSLDKEVKLDRVDLRRDTCCVLNTADPGQMQELMNSMDLNKHMFRKIAVPILTAQLLAVAELCASQQPAGPTGAQTITVSMLKSMLTRHTKMSKSNQETLATQQLYPRLITKFEGACTFYETSFAAYRSDEGFAFDGSNVEAIDANAEKMDMSGGKPAAHFILTSAAFAANEVELKKLCEQRVNAPVSALAAKAELDAQINTLRMEQFAIRNGMLYGTCDCEDGALATKIIMEVSAASPRELYEMVQPHIGTAILPLQKMYGVDGQKQAAPPGRLMHVGSAAPQEVRDRARTSELREIVCMTTQLISAALKWQSEPVNGKIISYEVCLGLASAPSLTGAGNAQQTQDVTREMFVSRPEFYGTKLKGHNLCGHCFASAVVSSDVRQTPDGVQTKIVEFSANSLLEKTTGNVRVGFRSRDDPLCENVSKVVLANKSVDISINGHLLELINIPHDQVRAKIAHVVQEKLVAAFAKQYTVCAGIDMRQGKYFYNFVSQVGAHLAVTGECTSKTGTSTQTSTLNAKATADEMHLACSIASFSESTLTWEENSKSNVTSTAVLSVPLCREEKERIAQLAHELTTIHAMTKDQLDNILTNMRHTVSVGFEGGTFTGTDWSGESLDTDSSVAVAFVLQMMPQTLVHADYANANVSASDVLQSKIERIFTGASVRVKEVETGAFLLQVLLQV